MKPILKKALFCVAIILILEIISCTSAPVKSRPASVDSENRYITATGIGDTEIEARKDAIAELSRYFGAQIESQMTSQASSVTENSGDELFNRKVESQIRVLSAVNLSGVDIHNTWRDETTGKYYTEARLDRFQALNAWSEEIDKLDNKIFQEFKQLETISSHALQLSPLSRITEMWVKKEVLVRKLGVLGFADPSTADYSMEDVQSRISEIRNNMRVCIKIHGPNGKTIADKIADAVSHAGYVVNSSGTGCTVGISGQVSLKPVQLNNPEWHFVRGRVSIDVTDIKTGASVAHITESIRAAHLSEDLAGEKAVRNLSQKVADRLISVFRAIN